MPCNWSLRSGQRLTLPRSSSSASLLDVSLCNLRPSFRFIRPAADISRWFTGPSGLRLSTAFLDLPAFLSFAGPFAAPLAFLSLAGLRCFFSAVLCFITLGPVAYNLHASPLYPLILMLWQIYSFLRVSWSEETAYYSCRNGFLHCRNTYTVTPASRKPDLGFVWVTHMWLNRSDFIKRRDSLSLYFCF